MIGGGPICYRAVAMQIILYPKKYVILGTGEACDRGPIWLQPFDETYFVRNNLHCYHSTPNGSSVEDIASLVLAKDDEDNNNVPLAKDDEDNNNVLLAKDDDI